MEIGHVPELRPLVEVALGAACRASVQDGSLVCFLTCRKWRRWMIAALQFSVIEYFRLIQRFQEHS
jgi:hypothetical protein